MTIRNRFAQGLAVAAALVVAAAAGPTAMADTLYWNAPTGGAGTWDTTTSNWYPLPTGGTGEVWTNSPPDSAVFGGTAGTVTLNATIDVGGLQFNTTGYGITSTGFSLDFEAANNAIVFNNIAAATITGPVGGSGNVTLTAANPNTAGTLNLNGTSTGGWTGTTTVNSGMTIALSADNQGLNSTSGITLNGGGITLTNASATAITNNRVSNSAAVTSNGGTFTYTNTSGTGVYAETIGSVALTTGQLNFNLATNQASTGSQTLTLSGLTRTGTTNSSAVTFSAASTAPNVTKNRIQVSGASATPAGQIIGPWATTGTAANNQNDYAVYDASGFILPANIAASAATTWSTDYTTGTGTLNNTLANAAGSAANGAITAAARNVNSVRNITTATATTSVNSTTNVFTLTGNSFVNGDVVTASGTGGLNNNLALNTFYVINKSGNDFQLSRTPGGAAVDLTNTTAGQIAGGITLSSGFNLGTYGILNGSTTPMAIGGSSGSVTLPTTASGNFFVTPGAGNIVISAPITDNGAGVLTLVKSGSGVLKLDNNSNTYSGGTVFNGGTVWVTDDAQLGAASTGLTFNGSAALSYGLNRTSGAGDATLNLGTRPITVNNGAVAGIYFNEANKNITISGAITGSGGIIYGRDPLITFGGGSGYENLNLLSNGNTFTGPITFGLGNENIGVGSTITINSLADSSSPITLNGQNGWTITLGSGATASMSLPNRPVNLLNSSSTFTNSNPTYTITLGAVSTTTAGAKTLKLGNGGAGGFIAGNITNGAGSIAVEKTGTGTWTISGNMSNTGGLTIGGGTVRLSGTNTYSGNTNFNASGTTLIFAGTQAVSPNTTFVMNTNASTSDSTARLLDDTGGVNDSFVSVPNTFTIQNNNAPGNAHTFIVGNNNTANGGTSSGTTTGSTIAFGTLNWGSYASGTTAYGPIQIQGTNGYRLQIDNVVLHNAANLTSLTVGNTFFTPTTANVTLGTVTVGTGNTGQGFQTLVLDGTSSDNRITGTISDASDVGISNRPLRVTKSNTSNWALNGTANSFTGSITFNTTTTSAGTLSYASAAGANTITFNQTTGSATLAYNGAGQTMSGAITASALTSGTITLDASGAGAIDYSNTGSLGVAASGNKTLILSGTNTGNNTLAGLWVNNTTGNATLTKNGVGKWILTGANTYTGATTINGGTLAVNGSLAAGSTVTVNAGGTLGGDGVINGSVIANGSVAPGNSIGTLDIGGNLTWNAGDDWVFELGPGDTADLVDIAGAFTRGTGADGAFMFDFAGSTATGTFTLVDFASTTFSGVGAFDYTNLGGGNSGSFNLTGSQLQFVVVPEPAMIAILGAGVTLLGLHVARRRRRAR